MFEGEDSVTLGVISSIRNVEDVENLRRSRIGGNPVNIQYLIPISVRPRSYGTQANVPWSSHLDAENVLMQWYL